MRLHRGFLAAAIRWLPFRQLFPLWLACGTAWAQSTPPTDMAGMDMDRPASSSSAAPVPQNDSMPPMQDMPGMPAAPAHPPSAKAVDHGDMSGMRMSPMQGGSPPPDARSADDSDGIGYGAMRGMDMQDNAPQSMLLVDQLEAVHTRHSNGQNWEAEGWYGNDDDKLWLRSEGERSSGGRLDDGDIEALWNHTVTAYWSSQLGIRQDMGEGPNRHWAAFGLQGLAPYWLELEATAYVGDAGRTAARFRAEYAWRFTQRLILQPELEVNAYGKSDPARRIGSGLSDADLGLRLRYEIHRQFAPYVGVVWTQRFGGTADFAREDAQADASGRRFERQWVAGIRFWF